MYICMCLRMWAYVLNIAGGWGGDGTGGRMEGMGWREGMVEERGGMGGDFHCMCSKLHYVCC